MADFKVPEIDFSWLGQLPQMFESGKKTAKERGLEEDLANVSLTAPDGTINFPDIAKVYAKHGYGQEAVSMLAKRPALTPGELLAHEDRTRALAAQYPWAAPPTQPTPAGVGPTQTAQAATQDETQVSDTPSERPRPRSKAEALADQKYAQGDYLQWKQGGFSETESNLKSLIHARDELKNNPDASYGGPEIGLLVKKSLAGQDDIYTAEARRFKPEPFNIAASHQRAVVASLRPLVGARAAQQLFQSVMNATHDPMAKPEENARRMDLVINNIESAGKAKQAMSEWFDQYGTLNSYKGPRFDPETFDPLAGVDSVASDEPLNAPPVPGATQPIQKDPRGPIIPSRSAPTNQGIVDWKDYFGQ